MMPVGSRWVCGAGLVVALGMLAAAPEARAEVVLGFAVQAGGRSVDFGGGLAPLAYTNLVATGPLLALSGSLEILDAEGPDQSDLLVLGRFTGASVSLD